MNRHDIDARAALYASLLTGPIPPEMTGTPEELAQRLRDRVAGARQTTKPPEGA